MTAVAPHSDNSSSPAQTIASGVLGDLLIPETSVFTFPDGMHGFAANQRFALVPAAHEGYWWLQAMDEAHLVFLLADPFLVAPGYEVDLSPGDIRFLSLDAPDAALVLTVVTLPAAQTDEPTTNLRGPVVFNTESQLARQVVSARDSYSMQQPIRIPTARRTPVEPMSLVAS